MFEPDLSNEHAHQFSRFDKDDPLSTSSPHPILLDDENWLTCEHYFSANSVRSVSAVQKIASAPTALDAYKYATPWYRWKRSDFKKVRVALMTRALYTKVQMYEEVRDALLATEDKKIIETSQYDYFWGIGRDLRGENYLGQIWMDIRRKISATKDTNSHK